jgi:hypothetical protein
LLVYIRGSFSIKAVPVPTKAIEQNIIAIKNGALTPAQTIRFKQALSQGYTAEEFMDALNKERARNSLKRQK